MNPHLRISLHIPCNNTDSSASVKISATGVPSFFSLATHPDVTTFYLSNYLLAGDYTLRRRIRHGERYVAEKDLLRRKIRRKEEYVEWDYTLRESTSRKKDTSQKSTSRKKV